MILSIKFRWHVSRRIPTTTMLEMAKWASPITDFFSSHPRRRVSPKREAPFDKAGAIDLFRQLCASLPHLLQLPPPSCGRFFRIEWLGLDRDSQSSVSSNWLDLSDRFPQGTDWGLRFTVGRLPISFSNRFDSPQTLNLNLKNRTLFSSSSSKY